MNILLSTPSGNGRLIQGGTIQDGITLANSLGLTEYNVAVYNAASVVVNDNTGGGFNINLNDEGTTERFLIFDTTSSNVLSWITTNYPTATLVTFGKTPIILATA
jgi:hypothetical protein